MKLKRILASILALITLLSLFVVPTQASDTNETVTVTVNYVYLSNNAMVAQPYTAQISKGSAFMKTVSVPKLYNYSIPSDRAVGLNEGIVLSQNDTTKEYSLAFDIDAVNENITVTLFYVAGKATYTVYHYYQNLSDDEYTQDPQVIELTGDIDAYTEAVANSNYGYHCEGVTQSTIAADGTTKVEIYYTRELYTVTFDVNGGINGPDPIYAKYGTTFEADDIEEPTRAGYTFLGWTPSLSGTVEITSDVTYTAQWKANLDQSDYTIVIWGQNADDDEYSYITSGEANGAVGDVVTWNADAYICEGAHTHSDKCYTLTCTQQEHTHDDGCLTCGKTAHTHSADCTCQLDEHTHSVSCYGVTGSGSATVPGSWDSKNDTKTFMDELGLESGYVYFYDDGQWFGATDHYILYFNGMYYDLTESQYNSIKTDNAVATKQFDGGGSISRDNGYKYKANFTCGKTEHTHTADCYCNLEEHTHTDSCYGCGITEHTHSSACYTLTCGKTAHTHTSDCKKMGSYAPDSSLWEFDYSDTVTVAGDGSTVLNVYFKRKEFTITFKDGNSTVYNITERWGADISSHWPIKGTNGTTYNSGERWKPSGSALYNYVLVYIAQMPAESFTLTKDTASYDAYTMNYYAETIAGGGEQNYSGKNFSLVFSIKAKYYYITEDEDFFSLQGFTQWKSDPSFSGRSISPSDKIADFYYTRNSYNLIFYSASDTVPDKTESVLYQNSLSQYNYTPTSKPSTVESDAVFMGWYQNPQCTGEPYDLSTHTMPAGNIALYAKWVDGIYTVKTFTDDTLNELYTYDGYSGVQTDIVKYTLATAPTTDPTKDGYVFVGWFYMDGDTEKPFSFTMPITRNYNLYPKFTNQATVEYTVHYYLENTTTQLADDRVASARIGSSVTEKAKMGSELNLAESSHVYFPDNTSTSIVLNSADQEIIFYYKKDITVPYTVKYVDDNGVSLISDKVVSGNTYSVVTESYVAIDHYAPEMYTITQELSTENTDANIIIFVYVPEVYTVTYDAAGGTLAGVSSTDYTIKDAVQIANPPSRLGYTFKGWKLEETTGSWGAGTYTAMAIMSVGQYGNITLVAQWQENEVTVNYQVVGPTGCGTVSLSSETVKVSTGTVAGSTASANGSYQFDGWYSDKDCTTLVSSSASYKPSKNTEGLWTAATYYAKFSCKLADLKITKTGCDTTKDPNQSFVFHVTADEFDAYVTVQGNGSVTIKNLPVDDYTVTEVTSWSWRYTPSNGEQTVTLVGGSENTVTFSNSRSNIKWLSGDSYAVNTADGANIH